MKLLLHKEQGATATEYAIIATLVAGMIVGVVRLIAPALIPYFLQAASAL